MRIRHSITAVAKAAIQRAYPGFIVMAGPYDVHHESRPVWLAENTDCKRAKHEQLQACPQTRVVTVGKKHLAYIIRKKPVIMDKEQKHKAFRS